MGTFTFCCVYLYAAAAKSLQSCPDSVRPHRRQPTRLPCPWDSPGKNTGVGCHFLLQLCHLNCVRLFATLRTAAHQAPLSTGFSRQEYWSGLPCPPPGDLSDPGIELAFLMSPALADRFFTTSATWEVRRMNLKSVIQNEVSQKEKNKFIWNLENGTDQPICMAGIETQM